MAIQTNQKRIKYGRRGWRMERSVSVSSVSVPSVPVSSVPESVYPESGVLVSLENRIEMTLVKET